MFLAGKVFIPEELRFTGSENPLFHFQSLISIVANGSGLVDHCLFKQTIFYW
jgi:hypothetical protein